MKANKSVSVAETLQQKQPFRSVAQEVYLSLLLSTSQLSYGMEVLLKKHGITQVQYNVLRILRGAGDSGLGRNEIRGRLVNTMPDVTRLLDRMERAGWISRAKSGEDKRQVSTFITAAGTKLLRNLEGPVAALHEMQIVGVTAADLKILLKVLAELRSNALKG